MKALFRELMIRWHRWRMVNCYAEDRATCRYHAERMVRLIKART